jgi:hypothetical protein
MSKNNSRNPYYRPDWRKWDWGFYGTILLGLTLIIVALYSTYEENAKWNDFRQTHKCVKISEIRLLVTAGWKCDDGVTYWR